MNEANKTKANELTPVEERAGFYFKREDYFEFGGANGGKVRALLVMARNAKGIVTCGDRTSTQIPRSAAVARALNIPCRLHTACGTPTQGMTSSSVTS